MEQIRSFVAVELPDELKLELSKLQAQLKSGGGFGVKWVDPYSIHLTLKFLGNVAQDKIEAVTKALEEAGRGVAPFHLKLRDLGVFPNARRVQVVWVGVSGEADKLLELQKRIDSNLALLGFTPESRPFAPHLTLARVRGQIPLDESQKFGELVTSTKFEATGDIEVEAISLMRSQLTPQGAIYTKISSVKLLS